MSCSLHFSPTGLQRAAGFVQLNYSAGIHSETVRCVVLCTLYLSIPPTVTPHHAVQLSGAGARHTTEKRGKPPIETFQNINHTANTIHNHDHTQRDTLCTLTHAHKHFLPNFTHPAPLFPTMMTSTGVWQGFPPLPDPQVHYPFGNGRWTLL